MKATLRSSFSLRASSISLSKMKRGSTGRPDRRACQSAWLSSNRRSRLNQQRVSGVSFESCGSVSIILYLSSFPGEPVFSSVDERAQDKVSQHQLLWQKQQQIVAHPHAGCQCCRDACEERGC